MQSKEKITELINCVKELTAQEREQFTSELLLMIVNESGHAGIHKTEADSAVKLPHPEADSKELAYLLKRLYYQHDEYIHRII